jgi:hypothetical protein
VRRGAGHRPGLSPESLSRLFESFYTTKPEGMDAPLDLPVNHRSPWWAIGCEPRGALFQFTIPAD